MYNLAQRVSRRPLSVKVYPMIMCNNFCMTFAQPFCRLSLLQIFATSSCKESIFKDAWKGRNLYKSGWRVIHVYINILKPSSLVISRATRYELTLNNTMISPYVYAWESCTIFKTQKWLWNPFDHLQQIYFPQLAWKFILPSPKGVPYCLLPKPDFIHQTSYFMSK